MQYLGIALSAIPGTEYTEFIDLASNRSKRALEPLEYSRIVDSYSSRWLWIGSLSSTNPLLLCFSALAVAIALRGCLVESSAYFV
eukprot:1186785-Prorocentrum_minimum.AAC.3